MKTYFTADELHTPEYAEYVKHTSEVWRLNDLRNKQLQAKDVPRESVQLELAI
jgi:hypothetical protein